MVGSTVTYRVLEDEETRQVTIVEPMNRKTYNQVSKSSVLGKTLMGCKKGDEIKVNADDSYTISILYVSNPIKKAIVQKQPIKIVTQKPQVPVDGDKNDNLILAQEGNYANSPSKVSDGLFLMHAYGTRAKDIYSDGVRCFGWNDSKKGSFGSQQKLYDVNCTKEGYSVLFLPYSNINNKKNDNANWTDFISSDFKTIKEIWKDTDKENFYDRTERITFAKQKNGQYIYIGIFQAEKIDEDAKCKYYTRINTDYL